LRSRLKLSSLEDGDGLATPLNVLIEGQVSQPEAAPPPKQMATYKGDDLDRRVSRNGA
jgi:hypothetical protein